MEIVEHWDDCWSTAWRTEMGLMSPAILPIVWSVIWWQTELCVLSLHWWLPWSRSVGILFSTRLSLGFGKNNITPMMVVRRCWSRYKTGYRRILLSEVAMGAKVARFVLMSWSCVLGFSCRYVQCGGNGPVLLFGVRAGSRFLSDGAGGPQWCKPSQGGHVSTATFVH